MDTPNRVARDKPGIGGVTADRTTLCRRKRRSLTHNRRAGSGLQRNCGVFRRQILPAYSPKRCVLSRAQGLLGQTAGSQFMHGVLQTLCWLSASDDLPYPECREETHLRFLQSRGDEEGRRLVREFDRLLYQKRIADSVQVA